VVRCPVYMDSGDLFGFVGIEYNEPASQVSVTVRQSVELAAREVSALYNNLKH